MCDESFLNTRRQDIQLCVNEALDEGHKRLDNVAKKSKILTDPTQADRLTHPRHIQCQPTGPMDKKGYMILLKEELRLRLGSDPAKFNASLGLIT